MQGNWTNYTLCHQSSNSSMVRASHCIAASESTESCRFDSCLEVKIFSQFAKIKKA